jgi:hypothetical protein
VEAETLPEVVAKAIEAGIAGSGWSLVDGMVVHGGRLFMPVSATAWHQVLAHAFGVGHEGVEDAAMSPHFVLHAGRQPTGARVHPWVLGVPAQQDGASPSSGFTSAARGTKLGVD